MTPRSSIRDATEHDAAACAAIYAPFVTDTAVSFETEAPTGPEFARRIAAARATHSWVVLEQAEQVVGYAYGAPYKARAAYRWTCEVSVYVAPHQTRRGAGRALYTALFERLADRGYRTAIAGMTEPNEASTGLHRALGFEPVGTFRAVGWKDGQWRDVTYVQRALAGGDDPPAAPR